MSRTSPVHYIAPSAISITPNANGSVNDLAVYVARSANIRVYSPRAGIGYDGNAEYQQWTLTGRNRRLSTAEKPYTIYARISKSDKSDGYLVFAPQVQDGGVWKDKYPYVTTDGLAKGTAGTATGNYWYIRLGDVSLPSEGGRAVTLDTGILGTDQYNTDWSVSPDALPLRVEVSCVVDDEDVGQNAYVYWDQVLVMTASLVEGWTGTDAQRFRHWSITRNTGNSDADAAWLLKDYVRAFKTTGSIRLSHIRGSFDDFGGAVSTMFTVTAWGVPEGQDDADESEYVVLAELPVSILAETAEKYSLVLTPNIIGYNPTTEEYSPAGGCVVSIRATDQRSDVFDVTFAQFRGAQLAGSYAEVGSSTWVPLTFSGSDDMPAQAVIPVSAFAAQKSLNVRLVNAAAKELDSGTVAFVRDGEDSRDREWIFLRSQEPITFGDASSEHPAPSYIQTGEVNPSGAAGAVTEDKNQEGWVPEGWWDEQQGTDADNPYEYGSYRDYVRATDEEDGHWGDFSMPRIWTHYGEDGILYSILTDADSVSIPTDQASVTTGFNAVFQRKAGDNTPAAYQCYYAAYRRHGNTYSRFEHSGLTRVSSVVFGNIAVSSDSASQNYCEAIVIYISDSPLSAGALQSAPPDSYLAKKEISVIKDGNTGPSGEDAYGVYVNPGYAIFEETLNSGTPVVDTSGWVGVIQVLKGSAPQPFKLTYGTHSHCRPTNDSTQEGVSVLEATVKFDLLKTQGAYSSEGYLAISVATDDGAYTNTNVKIPYYLSLLDTLKRAAANWFLSKEYDDTAKGNINFEQDVAVGGDFSVAGDTTIDGILMALEQIFTNRIQSDNFNGDGPFDTGFELTKGADGITSLVIDKLFVRMKAIFNELEIRKISYSGGNIIFSHAGSKVVYVTEIYEGGYEYQENIIVIDEGYYEHRGIFGVNGEFNKETRGVTLTGAHLEPNPIPRPSDDKIIAYRCYLLADDGSTATENWWRVDDQARWETFNIKEGTYQNVANTFGWRKVIATGTSPLHDGKMYDYIDLSRIDCAPGSEIPKIGDELVQMGNRTDAERQGFVTIEVAGDYAPAFKVYKGVNGYTLEGKRKVCISPKLTDIKAQRFVIETEYDAARVPFQRSEPWHEGMHCYYYDLLQHNGASWLCTFPEEGHEGVMYTTEEPSETATYWRVYAQKGEKGDSVSYDEEHSSIGYAYSAMGSPEQGREYPSDITSWSSTPPAVQKGKYLWTKDVTAYDNAGTIVYTTTYGVLYQPNDGESVEIDKDRTFTRYSTQKTASRPADSTFTLIDPPALGQGDYLWILSQTAYVGDPLVLKSYSVSRVGVDGNPGDPGADGYTTHFAYATSADGSQNFSTTNFMGATYIGTYRDQLPDDSTDYHHYVWTEWKGDDGKNVATCYVESQNVFITVDKEGKVVSDTDYVMIEVPFHVISGDKILCNLTATLSEDGSVNYAYFGNGGIYDPTNSHMTREGRGISIEGAYYEGRGIVLPADMTYTPSKVIIRVPKDTVLDEHAVHLNITATDDDGSTYTCLGDIQINGRAEGDDAVNASLTSPVVIIQQQTVDPYGLILTFAFTDILVTEGKSDVTDIITNVTLTPSKYDGVHDCCVVTRSGRRVTITQIATHSVGGKNVYVEEGDVNISFVYKGVTYNLPFRFMCNLLGTWKELVEADTKSAIAESTWFDLDEHGNIVESQRLGNFVQSSKENTAKLEELNYIAISHGTTNQFTLTADHIKQYGSTYRLVMDYQCSFETVTITIRKGAETIAIFTNVMSYDTFDEELTELTAGTYAIAFDKAVTLDRVDLFAVGADKFSEISQTVDNINLEIRNGLESTGINIDDGEIDLIANKIKFSYYDNGVKKSDKVKIDAATGILTFAGIQKRVPTVINDDNFDTYVLTTPTGLRYFDLDRIGSYVKFQLTAYHSYVIWLPCIDRNGSVYEVQPDGMTEEDVRAYIGNTVIIENDSSRDDLAITIWGASSLDDRQMQAIYIYPGSIGYFTCAAYPYEVGSYTYYESIIWTALGYNRGLITGPIQPT